MVGCTAKLSLRQNVSLPTNAGDCPEEKWADIVGDGGRERVKGLRVLAYRCDGGLRVEREEVQSVNQLWRKED